LVLFYKKELLPSYPAIRANKCRSMVISAGANFVSIRIWLACATATNSTA
jgi:hypothetical protein